MPQICVQVDVQDYNEIALRANDLSMSKARVAAELIHSGLGIEGNPEMEQLRGDLEHCQEINKLQYEDLSFLRLTLSQTQRLLTEPKKSWWSRFRAR
jgi:hypothetical protein